MGDRNSFKLTNKKKEQTLFKKTVSTSLRQQDYSQLYSPDIQDLLKLDHELSKSKQAYKNTDFARVMTKSNQRLLDKIVYNHKFKQVKLDRINSYVKTANMINLQKQDVLKRYIKHTLPDSLGNNGKGLKPNQIEKLDGDLKIIYELYKRSHHDHNSHTGDGLKKYITSTNLNDTIYISIDTEEYEHNKEVTEIGITIYDPRENGHYNIDGTYLGTTVPMYRKYHIIIDEEIKRRNSKFILCKKPESLFNETYILTKDETKKFLQNIWDRYFNNIEITKRGFKCALVGQSVDGDMRSLQNKFDIQSNFEFDYDLTLKKILADHSRKVLVYDTQKISERLLFTANSVKKQLRFLNIPHGSLHNALNDSYFTLVSFMTMTDIESRLNLKLDDPMELLKRYNLLNLIRHHPKKVIPLEVVYNIEKNEGNISDHKRLGKTTEQLEYGLPLKTEDHMDLIQ